MSKSYCPDCKSDNYQTEKYVCTLDCYLNECLDCGTKFLGIKLNYFK